MHHLEALILRDEMRRLASHTASLHWAEDGKGVPIGRQQWADAYAVAAVLDGAVPYLRKPTLGADPRGFVWINYDALGRSVEIAVHATLLARTFEWVVTRDGVRSHHASTDYRDTDADMRAIVETLRATFGHTDDARRLVTCAS